MNPLVTSVEWWKHRGKWTNSLVFYDGVFGQIRLEVGLALSFEIQPGVFCVGYSALSVPPSTFPLTSAPRKARLPCPSKAELKSGFKCSSCYRADSVRACLICDGTNCLADPSLQQTCREATTYVYLATFGADKVKVGVAHKTRIPQRWIEQGANLAKRIIVGNGFEARGYEKSIHDSMNVLSGLRTSQKVDTLWKRQETKELNAFVRAEDEIRTHFPSLPFYHDDLHDLSVVYHLPSLDRRPIELKIKKNLQISGTVLGAKGSLLLLSVRGISCFLNFTCFPSFATSAF